METCCVTLIKLTDQKQCLQAPTPFLWCTFPQRCCQTHFSFNYFFTFQRLQTLQFHLEWPVAAPQCQDKIKRSSLALKVPNLLRAITSEARRLTLWMVKACKRDVPGRNRLSALICEELQETVKEIKLRAIKPSGSDALVSVAPSPWCTNRISTVALSY